MKFKEIETVDPCEDVVIYWAALSDVPEAVQNRAREIDGQEYDGEGFGLCVGYDLAKKEFFIFTDEDPATGGGNAFYVDKDGDRRWFWVEIGAELTKQVFDACDRINTYVDTPRGYAIQKTVQFDRDFGLVLAKKDDPTYPFTAWMFKETAEGRRDYIWSHCYVDEKTAEKAFANAIAVHTEHERTFYSRKVKVTTWGAGKKPSIRGQLAAAKAALVERPAVQRHQKDKEAR